MSARMAWNGTGLVGALRSMNVSREDPEHWTLAALICSTKPPRTCAAWAPSAVEPARGICDSGRPTRRPLRASSAGRARKPLPRPYGASMPYAPGWLVWSVVRHDTDSVRAYWLCKANYAVTVREMMPRAGQAAIGHTPSLSYILPTLCHKLAYMPSFRVDVENDYAH